MAGARFSMAQLMAFAAAADDPPRANRNIVVSQSAGVQIVARAFEPIIVAQTAAVAIVASEGGGFDPLTDLTGTVLWFDMQDAGSYTESGGVVTAITNKATSVSYTEATNRPAFSATGINGFPCMDLDGTNDKLLSTADTSVETAFADQNDYYFAAVIQADDLDAVEVFFSVGNSGAAGAGSKRWGTNTSGSGKWNVSGTNDAVSGIAIDSTANTVTSAVLLEFECVGGATSIRVNGGARAPDSTASAYGTLTPDQAAIGCRAANPLSTFFDGRIGEIIGCSNANTAERAACATYLIDKWGIT